MLLGIPGDNTFSNYQEANRTFWRNTVIPLITRATSALADWLSPAYGTTALTLIPDLDEVQALAPERDTLCTDDEKRASVGSGPKPVSTSNSRHDGRGRFNPALRPPTPHSPRRHSRGAMSTDDEAWAQIHHAYCETSEPVEDICQRFRIQNSSLTKHRITFGWPMRTRAHRVIVLRANRALKRARLMAATPDRAPTAAAPPAYLAHPLALARPPPPPLPATAPHAPAAVALPRTAIAREELVLRLYRALTLKLSKLEEQMSEDTRLEPADHERQSRALTTIVRAFERTTEYDPAYAKSARSLTPHPALPAASPADTARAANAASPAAPSSDAASAELLRRDIAERLGRILERRNTPGSPG